MARIRLTAIVPHSTHDATGAQRWHEAGAGYEVASESDAENIIALGWATRVAEGAPEPAPAPAPPEPTPPPVRAARRR